MNIAVLTFPGHIFQTTLTINSIVKLYQPEQIHVLVDDIAARTWTSYVGDLKTWLASCFPNIKLEYTTYSQIDFQDCASGWWRAQLIKLHVDTLLSGDKWLLVDGDIIFERVADLDGITPYTSRTHGGADPIAVLHSNYVKNLLGISQGHLEVHGGYVATSPVPFRVVDRTLLQGIRNRAEAQHQQNFLKLHLQWFRDQSIIAFEDPPQRMIMSEWELIECYRHYVTNEPCKFMELGSGYNIDMDITSFMDPVLYKHSYKRDSQVGKSWFDQKFQTIPQQLWDQAEYWTNLYENHQQ
jgi:hypothetical protein